MSAIRRGQRPADRFTMISNEFHRDARLSFKARGIGGYLLSHAEGWETSVAAIAKANGVGRDLVRTGLQELEKFGYLRRERARTDDGRLAEVAYLIQCTPDDEPAGEDQGREIRRRTTRQRESRPHKNNSSKNNSPEEDHPSGGTADAVAAEDQEEAPEMPRSKAPEQPGLFEVMADIRPRQTGKTAAQAVVAAFVDSHRQHHGADPTGSEIGRVARDVKKLLATVTVERLLSAAEAMGRTPYANIAVQLRMAAKPSGKGIARAHPRESVEWHEGEQAVTAEAARAMRDMPELAAWLGAEAVTA